MDWTAIVLGSVMVVAGVAAIVGRRLAADFTADAVRQGEGNASLLDRDRTERDVVGPYTSPDGRRRTALVSVGVGVIAAAVCVDGTGS